MVLPLERVAPCSAGPSSQLQNFSRQSFPVETTLDRSYRVRTCCLIPMNSIKCLLAISIELCFSISNGTRPLCRSNADPSSSREKLRITFTTPLDAITKIKVNAPWCLLRTSGAFRILYQLICYLVTQRDTENSRNSFAVGKKLCCFY